MTLITMIGVRKFSLALVNVKSGAVTDLTLAEGAPSTFALSLDRRILAVRPQEERKKKSEDCIVYDTKSLKLLKIIDSEALPGFGGVTAVIDADHLLYYRSEVGWWFGYFLLDMRTMKTKKITSRKNLRCEVFTDLDAAKILQKSDSEK